jgi:DNA-binding NtrC family response regulator
MQDVYRTIARLVGADLTVLILGESGTGKELVARALHDMGRRKDGKFVVINLAAVPRERVETELFGREDGDYGKLVDADGGTLFLDEIGDMPLALQARLLRVLEERTVTPLGGGAPVAVDFRLICASHRKLKDEVAAGRFREDLYYRLNGLTLGLPPLRDRGDFAALATRLLAREAPERALTLQADVAAAFERYRWPGNVRQLANALRTAVALLEPGESVVTFALLPEDLRAELGADAPSTSAPAVEPGGDLRRLAEASIRETLAAVNGNMSEAARRLGISRNTLYRRVRG